MTKEDIKKKIQELSALLSNPHRPEYHILLKDKQDLEQNLSNLEKDEGTDN